MRKSLIMLFVLLLMTMTLIACNSSGGDNASEDDTDTNQSIDGNTDGSGNDENTSEPPPDPATITEFKQSPMLDGKDLPPVKDRLPEEPKLTNEMPPELLDYEIGTYGGTLRTVTSVVEWDADVFVMSNEPLLNTPGILGEEITGNVLKGYEVSSDQKTFTFYMRKGLKWSDGQPVTTEDVRFAVEDVLFNETLTPVFPGWLRSGGDPKGEPLKFEIIDEYTFKFSFDSPYGGLPIRLAIQGWRGYNDLLKPAHFLKQFHVDYTPLEQLEPLIKEAGFEPGQWDSLFHDKDIINTEITNSKAIGFPVLTPWIPVNKTTTTLEFERNPYYFKIDAAGNQLPYIDKIQSTLVQDIEMVSMKTIAGEVDFSRESAALVKMPLYKENEKNGYKALLAKMHVTPTDVFLNLTYEDETWRQVVRDLRFRKALNLAINRDEIIDSIYYGFAEPSIMQDPTYDLEEANRLLDEMGMKKGSNGIRTAPDGSKFSILFEVGAQAPDIVPLTELFVEFWRDLGLDVSMKRIDSTLWGTRLNANEIQATMIWTHTPLWYMADFGQGNWGQLWNRYNNNPSDTTNALEQPPEDVQRFYDLLKQVSVSPPEEGRQAVEQVKKEMGENLWYFVHIENVMQPMIVHEKLGNVSDKGFAIAANFSGEQFFFRP